MYFSVPLPPPEVESRTQGSRPRPRTQKNPRPKTAFPRTDTLEAKDRNARGQGHKRKCSPKKKKRSSQKFFRRSLKKKRSSQKFSKRSPRKNVFQKIFQALHKTLAIQKIVLSSSRGQANFRGLEAKAKDFKMCPRGQGRPRGLHLCPPHFPLVPPHFVHHGRRHCNNYGANIFYA